MTFNRQSATRCTCDSQSCTPFPCPLCSHHAFEVINGILHYMYLLQLYQKRTAQKSCNKKSSAKQQLNPVHKFVVVRAFDMYCKWTTYFLTNLFTYLNNRNCQPYADIIYGRPSGYVTRQMHCATLTLTKLANCIPVTLALGNAHTNFYLPTPVCFRIRSPYTWQKTEEWTGKIHNAAY